MEIASVLLGLIETAVALLGRIRKAYSRQKELTALLANHISGLERINATIRLVRDEDTLQTATVTAELLDMENLAKQLVALLDNLSRDRSGPAQLLHQLVHGSNDEQKLDIIMKHLGRAQDHLALRVQVAHVGLTKSLGDKMLMQAEAVARVDDLVRQVFDDGGGLQMVRLKRTPNSQDDMHAWRTRLPDKQTGQSHNAISHPTHEDLTALPTERADFKVVEGTRLVLGNMTEGQAIQINSPIGRENLVEVNHLAIKNNRSTGTSTMINHAISMDAFKALLDRRV